MKNTYLISFLLMAIIALPFTLCDAQNPEGERRILILTTNGGGAPPAAHAPSHTDGSDDIQDATAAQKGLATATQITKLDGIETSATADQTSIVGITGTLAQFDTAITDGNFLSDAGDTGTGVYDFGSTTSFEITNAAAPTVDAPGEIAIDTTIAEFSNGVIKFFGSAEEFGGVAMPIAQFTSPTDGHIVSYNAANDEFELVTPNGAFLQIRRTTSLALSPCFGTVSFDATDFETDTSVIQHNDT